MLLRSGAQERDYNERNKTMPGISPITISPFFRRGGAAFSYWEQSDKVLYLWTGKFDGDNLLSDIDDTVITVKDKDFSTSYIPYTSAATFAVPNNATFKAADDDLMWFNSSGTPKTIAVKQLVNFDYTRTIIKYDDESPYHIRAIMILKDGETLTDDEIDDLHKDFALWIYWAGTENELGHQKDNRVIDDIPEVLSTQVPAYHATTVEVTFDINLDEDVVPAAAVFTLTGSVTGAKTISNVTVSGAVVTLTVSVAFGDETITLNYTQPTDNAIRSALGGGKVASFTGQSVTNNLYGPELVVNGTFSADSGWTKGSGWTITGGVANSAGITNAAMNQNITLEAGSTYNFKVTVNRTSGGLYVFAGPNNDTRHFGTGWILGGGAQSFNVNGVAQATTTKVIAYCGNPGYVGTIDNLSIRKVQI